MSLSAFPGQILAISREINFTMKIEENLDKGKVGEIKQELNEFLELNEENERLIDTKDQNIDSLEYQQAILEKKLDVSRDEQSRYQKQAVRDVSEKDELEKEKKELCKFFGSEPNSFI